MAPSVHAASTQCPSRDTATPVTAAWSSSVNTRPMRASKRRTVPSTLPATTSPRGVTATEVTESRNPFST